MKILYGIQGTGNGHLTRSVEIISALRQKADVDVLISGEQYDLPLPFEPEYRRKGLYFVFGKKGGINLLETYKKIRTFRFLKEIKNFPVKQYDLVISDFEPISCWSAKMHGVKCIGLSNQSATLHSLAPKPGLADPLGKLILGYYAPAATEYGFSFKAFDENIFTPVIRREVRKLKVTEKKHFTVYLPSYDDERIIKNLKKFDDQQWDVFSKHSKKEYRTGNIRIRPIQNEQFLSSLASSKGIICNAGFGTTSEALFLGKKMLVIPMKNQYEQHCNAAMLGSMGVASIKSLKKKHHDHITEWIKNGQSVKVNYPDHAEMIAERLVGSAVKYEKR